jgi:hypothetical protein
MRAYPTAASGIDVVRGKSGNVLVIRGSGRAWRIGMTCASDRRVAFSGAFDAELE